VTLIYKKGSKKDSGNYKRIVSIVRSASLFAKIIYNKLQENLKQIISDQNDFSSDRGWPASSSASNKLVTKENSKGTHDLYWLGESIWFPSKLNMANSGRIYR